MKDKDELGKWILTDPDTNQWGRKLLQSDPKYSWVYEFKEGKEDSEYFHNFVINLNNYNIAKIEDIINGYGYSLLPYRKDYIFDIYHYKETVNWIIAETLFEYETGFY